MLTYSSCDSQLIVHQVNDILPTKAPLEYTGYKEAWISLPVVMITNEADDLHIFSANRWETVTMEIYCLHTQFITRKAV